MKMDARMMMIQWTSGSIISRNSHGVVEVAIIYREMAWQT